jgi:hypothetical protein
MEIEKGVHRGTLRASPVNQKELVLRVVFELRSFPCIGYILYPICLLLP